MKVLLLSLSIFFVNLSFCQDSTFRLFLIGDTGEDTIEQPTLKYFLDTISKYPNSAAVFLGDNCYHDGLLGQLKGFDSTELAIKRMKVQMEGIIKREYQGSVYYIPGNHDWWNNTNMKKGKRHLMMEQSFIDSMLRGNEFIQNNTSTFMPKDGNPIDAVNLNGNKLKLIFLDTQWLIIQKRKDERENVYSQLISVIDSAISNKQKIVITGHHPIYTLGKHSKAGWIPFIKQAKNQNIPYRSYREMRERIEKIMVSKKVISPIIYASGHDHVLQHFQIHKVHYIVSGAGSKSSRYNKKNEYNPKLKECFPENSVYKSTEGFFEVEYIGDGFKIHLHSMEKCLNKELIK